MADSTKAKTKTVDIKFGKPNRTVRSVRGAQTGLMAFVQLTNFRRGEGNKNVRAHEFKMKRTKLAEAI